MLETILREKADERKMKIAKNKHSYRDDKGEVLWNNLRV